MGIGAGADVGIAGRGHGPHSGAATSGTQTQQSKAAPGTVYGAMVPQEARRLVRHAVSVSLAASMQAGSDAASCCRLFPGDATGAAAFAWFAVRGALQGNASDRAFEVAAQSAVDFWLERAGGSREQDRGRDGDCSGFLELLPHAMDVSMPSSSSSSSPSSLLFDVPTDVVL